MTDIDFGYKNHRGEIGRRRVERESIEVFFGKTEYHPEDQMIMRAFDLEKQAWRDFALADVDWRPEGQTYFDAITARDHWQKDSQSWIENVEVMLTDGDDQDVVRAHEGGGPEDLKMSLVVSFMKTRKTRDAALLTVGELNETIVTMKSSARPIIGHWKTTRFAEYVLRVGEDSKATTHAQGFPAPLDVLRNFIILHEEG